MHINTEAAHHFKHSTHHFKVDTHHFKVDTHHFIVSMHNFKLSTHNFKVGAHNFRVSTRNFRISTHAYFRAKNSGQSAFVIPFRAPKPPDLKPEYSFFKPNIPKPTSPLPTFFGHHNAEVLTIL